MKDVIGKNIDWGFGSGDIWGTSMVVVGSLAGFLLLGIVIKFVPQLISMVKQSILHKQYYGHYLTIDNFRQMRIADEIRRRHFENK